MPRHVPTGVLVLLAVFPILAAGTIWVIVILNGAFALQANVFDAIRFNDQMFRAQLNEEAGIRGFAATGQRGMLEQFYTGRAQFARSSAALAATVDRIGVPGADERIRELQTTNDGWLHNVAEPTLKNPSSYARNLRAQRQRGGFRASEAELVEVVEQRAVVARLNTRRAVEQLAALTFVICVIVAALIMYASQRQQRLLRVIEAEQGTIETLQRALINHLKPVHGLELGTAYISATDGANVGGDFYDVQPLGGARCYVLVGDVSGKGVNAAVDTALVRHGVRSLFVVEDDPGVLLSNFNEAFLASRSGEDIFVAMFLGVIDLVSRELRYASAGHAQAYVREGGSTHALPVTGSLIGIDPGIVVESNRVQLQTDDLLFIATDGLTEARNADRAMLEDEGAMGWIQASNASTPQTLVDEIVTRLRSYAPKMRDDLAILALRLTGEADA